MVANAALAELYSDDDSLLLAKAIAEFSHRELAPYLRQLGKEQFPERFLSLAAQSGFLGTVVPEEYGGQGGKLEGFLPVLEGIAACDGSLALTLAAHESLATTHILLGGSPEQKRRYLPDLTAGRKIGAWCLTEPQAGSNIFKDTRTKLVRTGEGWRLNGEKTFITNGCHADLFVVLAQAVNSGGPEGREGKAASPPPLSTTKWECGAPTRRL
jgi:alkylation response protein AidB-like acyl-CoA dehydrogenase